LGDYFAELNSEETLFLAAGVVEIESSKKCSKKKVLKLKMRCQPLKEIMNMFSLKNNYKKYAFFFGSHCRI